MYNLESIERFRIIPLLELPVPPVYCTINKRPALTAGNFSLIYGKKRLGRHSY
jgi:hypothetical protein